MRTEVAQVVAAGAGELLEFLAQVASGKLDGNSVLRRHGREPGAAVRVQ